ncbi:metallophosphoesterase family protein [Alkalibacterium sp.]|nr:MAG: metallophosphoesterase [Alkalibacterium sp.]
MKLIIVSDNHGDTYYMEEILSIYENEVDSWIHCGDSEMKENHPLWQNYKTVIGNMDYATGFELERLVEFKENKFLVVHGHKHAVKQSNEEMKKRAKEEGVDIVFFGHTHIPSVEQEDGILFINPGSLTQPRDRNVGTYLLMDLDRDSEEVSLVFYDQNHNKLEELSASYSL